MIACATIASRARSTLILVDRKALADQWRDRLQKHLGFKCAQIGGGRSKTTGVIDVALLPTLARRNNIEDLTANYGFVVADECHHIGPLLIIGTSSFIGEGFDCPALDTLFLAAPITFKNRLVQYVGRITRPHPTKTTATVHDYHDELTPVLASSLRKRAPGYTKLGFPDPTKLVR